MIIGYPINPLPEDLRTFVWPLDRHREDMFVFGIAATLLEANPDQRKAWEENKVYAGWTFDEAVEILQNAKEAAERRLNQLLAMTEEEKPLSTKVFSNS